MLLFYIPTGSGEIGGIGGGELEILENAWSGGFGMKVGRKNNHKSYSPRSQFKFLIVCLSVPVLLVWALSDKLGR